MLLVWVLAACVCLAQSPQPVMTGSPVQQVAPKKQPQPGNQQNRQGQIRRRQQTDPVNPTPNGSVQPSPGGKHHGRGRRNPPSNNGQGSSGTEPKQISPSYSDALRRYRHERHDRTWWKQRYTVIVLVLGGYYYYDNGYWCPAWGFDTSNQYYDYDGPIYTYGNLLPDQVIANVQRALKELGYYNGEITGSLASATRNAIAAYQEDNGLEVTAVIDAPTVEALGLE